MTKAEYKKNLIRYFDSVRDSEEDPKRIMTTALCGGTSCKKCMFEPACTNMYFPENALYCVELLEKWAKEHPAITNKEKIEELFGVKIDSKRECPPGIEMCSSSTCKECRKWWSEEYKEPNGEVQNAGN